MPARPAALTFVIPARFHPGWSPLGRALRRLTSDRLRAEAFQIVLLVGAALLLLMGVYATEAAATLLSLSPIALWATLAGTGVLVGVGGGVGVRPRTVVTAGTEALRIERGGRRLRLPYADVASAEVVGPRRYHRHHRRYAAVQPFLGPPGAPVLLVRTGAGRAVALGLAEAERRALRRCLTEQRAPSSAAATEVAGP